MRRNGRAYCRGSLKRGFDLCISLLALVVLAPLLLLLALLLLIGSGRPVLFAQERIGMDGRPFRLLKFRTMRPDATRGLPITGSRDPRVTRVGRWLRALKLDELPQLVNVLRGEMSLVGPRPEVPRYVAQYSAAQREVFLTRPGLTDPASIAFVDEEALLGRVDEARRERFYLDEILPRKLDLNLEYIERAGFWYDLSLLLRTGLALLRPARP